MALAGLLYGPETHHLDHLAPLCSLLAIPLIVTEEEIDRQAKIYYPNLKILYLDYTKIADKTVQKFSTLITTLPRPLVQPIFFLAEELQKKRLRTIWCPHGNSDKGMTTFFMEALKTEEGALVYGPKMIDFLAQKEVFKHFKGHVVLGNYRYLYYKQHKEYFDCIAAREVFSHLPQHSRNILYAPTWDDAEESSSFLEACPILCEKLPDTHNLIVKLHPNLVRKNPLRIEQIIWKFEEKKNIYFTSDFPLVYPLLQHVDAYIGDMSSIGYDFLTFNKPMFFLNPRARDAATDPGLYLFRCGTEIPMNDLASIYKKMDKCPNFTAVQQEVFSYTFGHAIPWKETKKNIFKL